MPTTDLLARINSQTQNEEILRVLRRRIRRDIIGLALSLGVFIPAAIFFAITATLTGFSEYAALILSDSVVVLKFWKEYGSTLLETLPATYAFLVLLAAYGVIASGYAVVRDVRAFFSRSKFAFR
jgi:hypothetical protein